MNCIFHDCTVNGKPLATYGGAALLDYTIGETPLDVTTFQGINRTSWNLLKNMFTMREITLTVVFEGPDLREAKRNRSALNGVLFDKVDLFITDDGFYYTVICTGTGAETLIGQGNKTAQIKSTYTFKGVRHDERKTVTLSPGSNLYCLSTMPLTDCRLTATVRTPSTAYQFGGAVFSNVLYGDVLVFDGINGKILRNGANYAANVSWTEFPSLVPGWNEIQCPDTVTVEYEPTYI